MRPSSSSDDLLTVAEVAAILDRTPQAVRDLIAAGTLPAQRLGRVFVVARAEVERLQRLPRPAGRPWSPAVAWELIGLLDADARGGPTPDRNAARRRQLCDRDLGELAARLQVRAWRAPVALTSTRWRRLIEDELVVPSGEPLAVTVDAYVAATDLPTVRARYGLAPADGADGGAGVLRVVPAAVPTALLPRRPRAGAAAAALDAIEDPDLERHQAGMSALAALHQRVCRRPGPQT